MSKSGACPEGEPAAGHGMLSPPAGRPDGWIPDSAQSGPVNLLS